jgi:DNA-binding YbaB/EbfC family protein
MGGRFQEIQEQLKQQRVTGSSGGGMVEVEMTGTGEAIGLRIDPMLIERNELEMLQSLIPAAFNQASAKAKQCYAEAMKGMVGDLNLPGLDDALARLTGGA